MGDLGIFEADYNAGRLSAEAAANSGFELEKSVDRAIFRAKERFGSYLANSQSKSDFDERWAQVKPEVIKVIAEVTTPTPGVIRRVGAALRPPAPKAKAPAKQVRPSSAKTAAADDGSGKPWIPDPAERSALKADLDRALAADFKRVAAELTKQAWTYNDTTRLYTSNDPMQKFACPGCGTEQESLGFTKCAGCDKTWNSWPVRQASSAKTGAIAYVLMAREIKMRGDQFKLAAENNVKIATDDEGGDEDGFNGSPLNTGKNGAHEHANMRPKLAPSKRPEASVKVALGPESKKDDEPDDDSDDDSKKKTAAGPMEPPPGMSQPGFGTMPGDNSGATGAPMAPQQPATPMAAAGDRDGDGDVAGGVTEDSPIDQIQDALQDAIVALKDVQMLSVNPALLQTASATKVTKIANLRTAMDRFWTLHKQMNYVAGMLAMEAKDAIKAADPRITSEASFIAGFESAARNEPLPAKTGRAWLEGYVAFHKQAEDYSTGANTDKNYVPTGMDETAAGDKGSGFLDGKDGMQPANEIRGDAGTFTSDQPGSEKFVDWIDSRNNAGKNRAQTGEATSIQPTSARRSSPKSAS